MASKKKHKAMVLHQDGAAGPAAAPAADHPPARRAARKPGRASEGGMENTCVTKEEADMAGKPNRYPSKEPIRTSDGLPSGKHAAGLNPQSDNLSPDRTCKGVKVTLDNNSMWNEFFRCKTEMILTKQGSRMFPYCRFRISGLQPSRKYFLFMDIQPLDNSRHKWTGKSWQVAGKAECHVKSQPFVHPESPSTGQHWMQNPVSFYKLKLTNSVSDQEGNAVLHPMHRYLPRLHVVQTDSAAKDIKLSGPSVVTFTFHQTEFIAVTAYQNSRFSQLKVDYNPFAKGLKEEGSGGLKLKCISSKDSRKDGSTTTNEQHPVKKSLKSLLANHKPRSSKAADAKPLGSGDLQKNSAPNEDQADAKVSGESLCNSRPAQKLFSELIREAHVSLHRCNLDELGIGTRPEQSSTKSSALKSSEQDDPRRKEKQGETITTRNVRDPLNLLNSKDNFRTDCSEVSDDVAAPAGSQNSSLDSDHQQRPEAPLKVKQQKRPLPLPALALFLKQHSSKSKMAKKKLDSPPSALPPKCPSDSQSPAAAPECPPPDAGSRATCSPKERTGDVTKTQTQACGPTGALHPHEVVLSVTGPAAETARKTSSPLSPDAVATTEPEGLRPDDLLPCDSAAEARGPDPSGPDGGPVFPSKDPSLCILGTSLSTGPSSPAAFPIPSSPLNTVLPAPDSTLPSDSPRSDSLLPDPECSSFGFEPLSPASSPEPLPSLPVSFALELDSTPSESTPNAVSPEGPPPGEDSSVFKWHTVLPPPEPYVDPSFAAFQPAPQTLAFESVASPLLPLQTLSHSEPQTLDSDPSPSFQDTEPLLPFPAELSPLALQMALSPTFSSLDGDGLSPTPSIADLVHFFSINDDLGMGVEFSHTEALAVPCPPPGTVEAQAPEPQPGPLIPANKPCRHKKKSRLRKPADQEENKMDASTYTSMQPNLEEVEEQLFISFTSKEALRLHVVDSSDGTASQPQTTPEGQPQHTPAAAAESAETTEEETIAAAEKLLLKDLKQMRHGQVIHPVLQEVGLKMNLLDPTLAIDLQYLGVRLPIPPPGAPLEPPPPPGASPAFVSRTGKTTDVTQIKGWREKFSPSEAAAPSQTPANPEAGPSSDLPKKNLSAFCSDMLDEYLENEGKLIDQRASSFTQMLEEPVVYKLPTRSTSYVRTLDNVLKKQSASSPTSDLISGFIPPSKRPKLALGETKTFRRQKGPKHNKPRAEPAPAVTPAESNPKPPSVHIPAPPPSDNTSGVTDPQKPKRHQLNVLFDPTDPLTPSAPHKRRRKLKPKTSSQTLSPSKSTTPPPGVPQDMAPLESDSELGNVGRREKDRAPVMTRALLRQKDLEDGVLWEGLPRTSVTEERAAIALTSLFTLKGFARENPTAPIQLVRRDAPLCLNECCRLGCVCSSLSHCSRTSHCGRPACMFGCSCLKQKVVLLKNLDGSDSSPSQHGRSRRRRRRRMKMAYVLKEADSVSQPAERVRTLWTRSAGGSDPEPVLVPEAAAPCQPAVSTAKGQDDSSCARVRLYVGKKKKRKRTRKDQPESCDHPAETSNELKPPRQKKTCSPPAGDPAQPAAPGRPPACPLEPKPSKRLTIVAECEWVRDGDRIRVLKKLCQAMAQDRLDQPFWIKDYLISPISQNEEDGAADRCIHYKMHISRPPLERQKPARPVKPEKPERRQRLRKQRETEHQQEPLKQVVVEAEPPEEWQREVEEEPDEEEAEPPEDWQREVEEEEEPDEGQVEPLEDWQREVEEEEEEGTKKEVKLVSKRKMMVSKALPFLTGVSPAGFLSANRKQPGGTDHLVQVNGKLYPLAKIQLGMMGALHPANRLAAYLTGRVGSNRKPRPSSPSPSQPPQNQSSGPIASSEAPTLRSGLPSAAVKVDQSASSSHRSADPQVSSFVASPVTAAPKGSQVVMYQFPAPPSNLPLPVRFSCPPPPIASTGHSMVLQPVQSKSGVQYYRRPDGKLVQLVPISQLRSVNQNLPVQRALQTSTTVTSALPSALTSPLRPGFVAQTGSCTFKLLPSGSSRDQVIVACPSGPSRAPPPGCFTLLQPHPPAAPPMSLVSLKPSTSEGAEPGVKALTVYAAPSAPGGVQVQTPGPPPEPASDPVDLDIICVDDEAEPPEGGGARREGEEQPGASSETDNSSDFGDELDDEDEAKELILDKHRQLHNNMEHQRRVKLLQLFEGLKREVGLSEERSSKIFTLKQAVRVIQDLRTADSRLKKKRRRLRKRRDEYLSIIVPAEESVQPEGTPRTRDSEGTPRTRDSEGTPRTRDSEGTPRTRDSEGTPRTRDSEGTPRTRDSKGTPKTRDSDSVRMKQLVGALSLTASVRALRSAIDCKDSSKTLLLVQACQEIQTLQNESARLKSVKTSLQQQRDAFIRALALRSGQSQQRIFSELQQQFAKQKERHQSANQLPAAAGGGASTDDVTMTPPSSPQRRAPLAPSTPVLQVPVLAPPGVSHNASVPRDRPRTVPNILSRSRTPKALGRAEVLSLVRAALPEQQVLTARPAGMTSVTLNLHNRTNQQIHLASLPRPPAANFNNQLQLVQPPSTQQILQPPSTQQILQPPSTQQILQPPSTQQILQPPSTQQILQPPSTQQILQPPSTQQILQPPSTQQILHQQTGSLEAPENPSSVGGAPERGRAHSPWLLELDSDSDDLADATRGGSADGNANVLAPPPLLQMKLGGAKRRRNKMRSRSLGPDGTGTRTQRQATRSGAAQRADRMTAAAAQRSSSR
ncbi:MAX dimerization protein MGA a [Clinocottus analis]|uniref:MAX dimerization protein MGA a n=1 Tax=Clinocottus analis TaxID=304258 RepID=UPI0035BF93AB